MTEQMLLVVAPYLVLGLATAVVMLVAAFGGSLRVVALLTGATLLLALAAIGVVPASASRAATALFVVDDYALFYTGLLLLASLAVVVLSFGYFSSRAEEHGSFYVLLLLATLGASALAASTHFASFFLALEVLSVSLYALIAYQHERAIAIEAGMKYLILAGASSAFLLFGIALLYADVGSMALGDVARVASGALGLFGAAMVVAGVGFKLAVVPFHLWTPDVYQGSPAPVTAFIATVSKGGVFAVLLRFFGQTGVRQESLFLAFAFIAIASMFAGNLLALQQANVKRLLAYSSISHLGYILVAFTASGALGATAATFYVVAYMVTVLGAFGVVSVLSDVGREAELPGDYRGLFWRRPLLAVVFTAMLLSLAGLPLTAGFIGKFYVVLAGIGAAGGGLMGAVLWVLVVSLVVASTIGLFYYLRLAASLYAREPGESMVWPALHPPSLGGLVVLVVLTLLLVGLGTYPTPVLDLIQATVTRLA
ncbi:MAG: NADH-quinone oxidoreductase subunit N [Chloroflexota bacterium]